MKKLLVITLLCTLFLTTAFLSVKAYNFNNDSGLKSMGASAELDSNQQTPEYYIGTVLSLFFSFLSLIFLILTIYAGILWMTAQGDTGQVTKAKETLIRAIVGLVISIAAYGITYFVMNMFQGNQTAFINTPTNITEGPFVTPKA